MGIWGNDGSERRAMRGQQQRDRALVLRHRWYAGGVATLISAALVFTGVSTPAMADTVPPPPDASAATPPPADTPPAETPPAETPPADTPPAVETPPADTTTPPAETPPSDTTTPPSDTTAPPADPTVPPADGSKTDSTESQIAPDEGLISPLSLAPACTNNCSNITFNAVINGGSATVADWTYRADRASSPDWYDFVPPQTIAVPRNATYAITATPNNATAQAYNTTVTCTDPGSGVTWNSPNLAFNNNSGLASTCTATHTFIAPQQATITVKVGSDRTGTTGVTNLAGVVLYLQSNTGGGAGAPSGTRADGVAGDAAGWARCVSDANGDCVFTVPDTQAGGANNGTQPWVVQHSVPAGYYANPTLRVGGATGDGSSLAYQFRMKVGISGTTAYSSLNANQLMLSSGTEGNASQGIWQQSRNNPTLQASCGLDVALILDLSGSVGDTTNLKQAANTFVNSLQGTPSRMSLFSFSWQTPASQAGPNVANLTSVATAAQGTAFKNLYANWDSDGGTNWDRGLGIAAESNTANNKFDVAVIITDGNPTTYNQPYQGSGSNNRFRETENGIYSANALKAAGTRVIAFGVGAGANGTNTALNLRSISGPTVYNGGNGAVADYYQTTDYAAVGTALRNLALGNCQGTLTVTKQIVPESAPPGSITGAVPAGAGWQFTSVMNTPGVTTPNPVRTTTADGTGTVTYPMTFPGGTLNGSVTVTEAQQPGFVLQPVNLQNAVCTNKTTNQPVIPSNVVDGFTVAVPSTDLVNCIVYNRAPSPESDVTVTKNWVVNGVPVANGAQPSGLSAQLHLTGPGNNTPTDQGWGVTRGGYTKGGNTTLTETVTLIDPAMCTNNAVITNLNGAATNIPLPGGGYVMTLPNEHNTATITNTVTCDSRLTLIKTVQGGNAAPTSWTLNASFLATPEVPAGVPGFSGATGAPGTTGQLVTPDARYQLFETGGSPLYAQTDNRTNLQSNPLSTGSATCIRVDANGAPWAGSGYSDGINGGVNVPLGYRVACTLVNQNAELTLLKNVVNDNGGSSPASAWSLTATPATLTGLSATSVAGSETVVPASMFEVRPRHVYTLTESNVAGYQFVKLQQFVGGVWVDVVANADPALYPQKNAQGNWQIQVAALDEAVYRFVNDDVAPKLTLVKTVTNDHGGTAQPGAWTLTATTPGGPNLSGTTGINGAVEAGEVYTIGENSGPSGYTWDTLSCTGYPNTTKAAPTLTLKPGDDVTCTLNNNDQPGQLTLVKVVDNANGGTAVAADWNGKLHAKRGSDATLNYNTSETKPVPAGTYTLTETGQLAGYDLTNLECSTGGTTLANNTVVVANGANVTCTFTNAAQKPTLTLEKQVVNTGGGTATADQWTLTATNGGNTPINGTGTPAGGSVASISGAVLGNTTYTLTESGPSGYNSTGIWACVVTGSQTVVPVTNNNQVKTAVGQNVTCRIVNTAIPATGTVAKSVLSTVQNADGTWTIRYRITVTNGSASSNYTYNLVDTLNYGGGLTPTSATVPVVPAGATANPAWTGLNPNTNLASNVSLTAVQHTHVWEIEVVSTVAASVPSGDTWKCEGGPTPGAGGFLNTVEVFRPGQQAPDGTAHACSEPSFPDVTKVAGTPTQNPDASWNISYTITVKNPGASPISATLTDAFPATPAGWTLAGGVWNIAAQGGAPITNTTSAASPIWSGTLPANTTYTYIVSGKLTPTAGATPIGDCQTQGKGLTNTATVTSGSVSDTSGDCVSIVTPPVTVTKTDGTVSQLVDGTWQIDYTVTVTNGGTQATVYTLTDTPDLGTGFTLVSGTWFGPAPVANTPIEGGGFDQYVYRVIASFNPATPDPELTCDTTNGGAFFNKALVTFPGGTDDDTGCGEPESPTVEKSASAATQAPGGEWTLTYTVTVDNTSEMALAYTASDTPAALPAGVTLTTPWAVTGPAALNGGTATLTPGWTGTAPNTQFATGHLLAGTAHTYTVKAGVTLSAGVTPATLTCGQTPGGNGFWNSATVTNGVGTSDDSACVTVPFDDVGIVKTTEGVDGPVESDGVFKYVLTVTNHGTRAATNVKVTDPVPSRLTVTGIDLTDATGWTNDNDPDFVGEGNTVDLTGPVSFGVGATAEIVLTVKVNPVPVPEIPNLNEGDPVPTPELPMSTLVNEACVSADMDSVPGNDCDSVTVETKDIAAIVYTRCVGDAPLIGFVVAKTPNLAALPVDFTWTPNSPEPDTDPAEVAKQYPGGTATVSDEFAWVGTAFTPSGVSLDYPGWRALQASDYAPGGGYYIPGTTDVMTPTDEEEMIFNGLILDPSELDYAWRDTTTVVLSVNPSMTFTVEYPDATPECFVARHTEVQIEKTASVEKTDPGKSFTYTLAAANVSDDSAADGVVVTDTIPADLKITDVSWTGKGDANVFPNWSTCAVSGQNGAGYGGTLTCELFGPLQPAGSGLGASAAPTITLSATVNASSKASVITNVGVVDYYTFGDPTDTGRDADDAVVLLSGLPATGGSALTPLILLGFLALLGGTATIVMIRRRRGSTKPQL